MGTTRAMMPPPCSSDVYRAGFGCEFGMRKKKHKSKKCRRPTHPAIKKGSSQYNNSKNKELSISHVNLHDRAKR